MERISCKLIGMIIFLIRIDGLYAEVNFGSNSSAIKVSQQATLKISSSNLQVEGTLAKGDDASITGQAVAFSNGLLEMAGKAINLSGSYDPSNAATDITLQDGDYLRVEPGALISKLTVAGSDTKIEGAPLFSKTIELANQSSQLTLALQNRLNKSIVLNQGTLHLENDLSLLDNVFLRGPGTVNLKGRNLYLGSHYTSDWSTDLDFEHAKGIFLNGDIKLDGRWRFDGINKINGNGSVINLQKTASSLQSEKRRLLVKQQSSLLLADLYLKNLRNEMIKINSNQGTLSLSNVTVELVEDVIIDSGELAVTGQVTIILNGNTLSFTNAGTLKVTGRLYIDKTGVPGGDIRVGGESIASKAPGTSGSNYDLGKKAVVVSSTHLSASGTATVPSHRKNSAEEVLGLDERGYMYMSALLDHPINVPVDKSITVANSLVIDGQGTSLTFNNVASDVMRNKEVKKAQLAVAPNREVTLKNITLSRVTSRSFDLQQTYDDMTKEVAGRGTLLLGDNVVLELEEDTVISQGFIKVLATSWPNVPIIRGINGKKKLIIHPTSKLPKNTTLFDLGSASLKLENVELVGIQNITYNARRGASIVLGGGATVNVVATNGDVNNPEIDLNFDVEGVNNELVVRQDALAFTGNIAFPGYASSNVLAVRCAPLQLLPDTHSLKQGVEAGMPLIRFAGNPGIFLTTNTSASTLEFLNRTTFIKLENPGSFIVFGGKDAFGSATLKAKKLHVLGNSIKQLSSNFVVDIDSLYGFIDVELQRRTPLHDTIGAMTTTTFMKNIHDHATSAQEQYDVIRRNKPKQVASVKKIRRSNQKRLYKMPMPLRCSMDPEFINDGMVSNIIKRNKKVSLPLLDSYDVVVDYLFDCADNALKGSIYVTQGAIKNFYVDSGMICQLALGGDAQLVQSAGRPIHFMAKDSITVEGRNNVITVADNVTIDCPIALDQDAELIINFSGTGGNKPVVSLSALTIPEGAMVRCSGDGTVVLGAKATISLQGEYAVDQQELKGAVLQLENGAVLKIVEKGAITGVGIVNVRSGSQLCVEDKLLIAQHDDECLAFNFDNAVLHVEGLAGSKAYLTTGSGTSFWTFANKSLLTVANDGVFGVNLNAIKNNAVELKRGYFASLVLRDNSTVYLAKGGTLLLAPNKPTQRLRRELALQLFADPASWLGEGEVEFLDTNGKRVTKQPIKESRGLRLVDFQTTTKRLAEALQGSF